MIAGRMRVRQRPLQVISFGTASEHPSSSCDRTAPTRKSRTVTIGY
jgi:hypothetical protein